MHSYTHTGPPLMGLYICKINLESVLEEIMSLTYKPGDPIYDAAIAQRNTAYDVVLETALNAQFFKTRRDRFGNVTLQSTATSYNGTLKAAEAMQMIQAVTIAKLKPIEDNMATAQQGFQLFHQVTTGNVVAPVTP